MWQFSAVSHDALQTTVLVLLVEAWFWRLFEGRVGSIAYIGQLENYIGHLSEIAYPTFK